MRNENVGLKVVREGEEGWTPVVWRRKNSARSEGGV